MDSLIDKSGLGNQKMIVDSYAGMVQYKNLKNYASELDTQCAQTFNTNELTNIDNRKIYSISENSIFPMSENWAYAASWASVGGKDYYNLVPNGLILPDGYSPATKKIAAGLDLNNYYPRFAMSACARNNLKNIDYAQKEKDYLTSYNSAISSDSKDDKKIAILKSLTKFQYELYRDWGFLSVLGLPVTKMQTEYLGGLYDVENNFIKKANEEIGGGNWVGEKIHGFLSSLPYLLLPGAETVYTVTKENAGKLGAAIGGTATSGGGITAAIGAVVGGALGTVGSSMIGFSIATIYAKTILVLSPILAILVFGLGRFLIIIIKIFLIHFVSLLLIPIIFASENMKYFALFTMKVFVTMLELPIFVLAVWLAITANSLIHSIGDVFSKKIILGMLENNEINSAATEITLESFTTMNFEYTNIFKIFILDGFMEIAISVFSIIIIYRLIITTHTSIFEMVELKGLQQLDSVTDSIGHEMKGFGGKV